MGWSIQRVGDSTEMFNDGALVALLCLMEDEVERTPERFPALRSVVAGWQAATENSGPGTIELELDGVARVPTQRDELALLLDILKRRLSGTATIPGSALNRRARDESIYPGEYPTAPVLETLGKLKQLVGA